MSAAGSQTSRPAYTRQAEEGSVIVAAGHPPAITVGFDWLQTAARVIWIFPREG